MHAHHVAYASLPHQPHQSLLLLFTTENCLNPTPCQLLDLVLTHVKMLRNQSVLITHFTSHNANIISLSIVSKCSFSNLSNTTYT